MRSNLLGLVVLFLSCSLVTLSTVRAQTPPLKGSERELRSLLLFVHCLGSWDRDDLRDSYGKKWKELLAQEAPNPHTAVCFLTSGPEASSVIDFAKEKFGDRCIVDPFDNSIATRALLADDLEAAFYGRGMISEWTPYEMWTSTNARKWTEGLKIEFKQRGFRYDTKQLQVVALGQQWGGCLAKYSAFMSKYLGLEKPAHIRPDLSPYAGYPLQATYRETVTLDRHVHLFLFEAADGRPMAQFLDGLRGVFDPPHVAAIPLNIEQVEIVTVPPNATQLPQPVANPIANGTVLVDVGDGCRPVISTVVAKKLSYEEFRAAAVKAKISPYALKHDSRVRHVPAGCSDLLCPVNQRPPLGIEAAKAKP